MPLVDGVTRFLVKARAGVTPATLTLAAKEMPLGVEPLFQSIGGSGDLAAVGQDRWFVVTPPLGALEGNAWDLCHALLSGELGVAGMPPPAFVEPDFQQHWVGAAFADQALAMGQGCDRANPPDPGFPHPDNPLWFQDNEHAQFSQARDTVGEPSDNRVRIAHLDTGYDPGHRALPPHLNRDLQRNFVDADRPRDATDNTDGLLNNLGHGTGTIGILAGRIANGDAIGGAPMAEVVPIRVANRVVLFANSAIAKAFDYVYGLCQRPDTRVDVVTMSMGGIASQAWAEAVNALYDAGVFVVTAAGNNFGNLPTRYIVYPARFRRVVAACGVMADHAAYADLGFNKMAGNYGPAEKMRTAVSAFTPNCPWARLGCESIVDRNGAGTSAATPQVAAAAALWIQQNRAALKSYPAWMRVEAVRAALFGSARLGVNQPSSHFGRGELRAKDALGQSPLTPAELANRKEPEDDASFPIFRILSGLGLEPQLSPVQRRMLELEALQLSQSAEVEKVLHDIGVPPERMTSQQAQKVADVLASQPGASRRLRDALGKNGPRRPQFQPPPVSITDAVKKLHIEKALAPDIPKPVSRRLRVFAYDPTSGLRLETLGINETVLDVRWEDLLPGPVGEYLEVVDVDPASRACYAPIDLNHPPLLVQNGLRPVEASPQFHQQMTYAVAMKTIQYFEEALGRVALWAPRRVENEGVFVREDYVQRLRIYPHALRAENAYYSPERVALLLGYFVASEGSGGDVPPGSVVFSAVSHDIIAHETTHALLDGLHRRYKEPSNIDVLAFHEAFADIVALFQHFTIPEALRAQIAKTRGDLKQKSLLAELAVQFGLATGRYGALRDAIGRVNKDPATGAEQWVLTPPKGDEYETATEAHDRGAVLVAAVFDAFIQIYQERAMELITLATGGTGVLPAGQLSTALTDRLSREASKVARQFLNICIRALDYCPPVDIRFGEYLRALITADRDLVPDDKRSYRVAFISAFRDRGIYPVDVRHLSVDSLAWEPPPLPLRKIGDIIDQMSLSWDLGSNRRKAYEASRENAERFHAWLLNPDEVTDEEIDALGFRRDPQTVQEVGGKKGTLSGIEVHSVRPARRIGPEGRSRVDVDLVIEITQTFRLAAPSREKFRGGCTLIVDLAKKQVRYFVRKSVMKSERLEEQLKMSAPDDSGLRASYFGDGRAPAEPFAMLHRPRARGRSGHG
jgi:hypothetical protein